MAETPHVTSLSDHGLLPFCRRLGCAVEVEIPFDVVARAARVCLAQLVADSLAPATARGPETVASTRRGARLLKVAVDAEVSSARLRSSVVGHLRWHARRLRRLFPVMEADLVARPSRGGRTELFLDVTYQPPGGLLGIVGDMLLGRLVARSTVEAFTGELARTMEDAVRNGRCGWETAGHLSRGVA